MDLNALRVFDALHDLGLSEENYRSLEDEQGKDYTGVYVETVKKGFAIGVSHDSKHAIFIKKIPKAKPKCRGET